MDLALLVMAAPVIAAFAVGMLVSRSIIVSVLLGFVVLGYIAINSGDGTLMGLFLLIVTIMVMGTAAFGAKTILGDTA